MPKVKPGEKKKDFISRCIPILIDEGREQKQAAAICYSMWDRKDEETEQILNKVLNEAKDDYTVMFLDPMLEKPDKDRKNTLVTGKVVKNKLQIIDGEVWIGASFLDDVMPGVADLVKKWKPQTVFVEDNYFQRLLKQEAKNYNIPFKGVTRQTSRMAIENSADTSKEIEWKAKKNPDLFFGAGSLLSNLKKMNKVISESTVVADVEQNLTKDKNIVTRKKKCKKSKKFKEFLSKDAE